MSSDHPTPAEIDIDDDELLDADAACKDVGGSKPISRATLYRMVKRGAIDPPVKISLNVSRFRRSGLRRAKIGCVAKRDGQAT